MYVLLKVPHCSFDVLAHSNEGRQLIHTQNGELCETNSVQGLVFLLSVAVSYGTVVDPVAYLLQSLLCLSKPTGENCFTLDFIKYLCYHFENFYTKILHHVAA